MLRMNEPGLGRRDETQLKAEVLSRFSADLVGGVAAVEGSSKAHKVEDQVGSFLDSRECYYVHQRGGEFIRWKTEEVPGGTGAENVIFAFSMGTGFGSALPQPSGWFELSLNGEKLLSFRAAKENILWEGNGARFFYDVKQVRFAEPGVSLRIDSHICEEHTATFGVGFLLVPKSAVGEGEGATLEVKAMNRQPSERWFKLDVGPWSRPVAKAHLDKGIEAVSSPRAPRTLGDYVVLFGDIHGHSGHGTEEIRGCGTGTVDENYLYARDVSALDLFALAEHDWQMPTDADWRLRLDKADEYDHPGRFVVLPCFEWTSPGYGHRNVYFRKAGGPLFYSSKAINVIGPANQTPKELWAGLRAAKAEAITVAHHPNVSVFAVDWSYRDAQFDRLVEVYSSWGNSEYLGAPYMGSVCDREPGMGVLDGLLMGHRLGIVASSDGHDGNPGNAQWSERQRHLKHHLGSGLVAVLAEEFTREAVYEAMYQRRCYATTGVRILLDFSANGKPMGSELKLRKGEKVVLRFRIRGTTDLDKVELLENGGVLWRDLDIGCPAIDGEFETSGSPGTFYYLRVSQRDGEMAWSSPIWID